MHHRMFVAVMLACLVGCAQPPAQPKRTDAQPGQQVEAVNPTGAGKISFQFRQSFDFQTGVVGPGKAGALLPDAPLDVYFDELPTEALGPNPPMRALFPARGAKIAAAGAGSGVGFATCQRVLAQEPAAASFQLDQTPLGAIVCVRTVDGRTVVATLRGLSPQAGQSGQPETARAQVVTLEYQVF